MDVGTLLFTKGNSIAWMNTKVVYGQLLWLPCFAILCVTAVLLAMRKIEQCVAGHTGECMNRAYIGITNLPLHESIIHNKSRS